MTLCLETGIELPPEKYAILKLLIEWTEYHPSLKAKRDIRILLANLDITVRLYYLGEINSAKEVKTLLVMELYKQAATNYKLAKRWDDAAAAYLECVECDNMCKGGQAADYLQEAATMKEKTNPAGTFEWS
ncbi:unnamed protein product [Sphagnum balticum]